MSAPDDAAGQRPAGWLMTLAAAGTLAFCLAYLFAYVFLALYPGFDYDSQWHVLGFDVECRDHTDWCAANQDSLRVGDRLLEIGGLTYQAYERSRTQTPFAGYTAGERVSIVFDRDGVVVRADWLMLGPTGASLLTRLGGGLALFLPFWLAGTTVLLFLRPRNARWYLLIAFNYVTATWAATGIPSVTRIFASTLMLNALTWLLVPVYLHLHLHLFLPTSRLPAFRRYIAALGYAVAAVLALLALFNVQIIRANVAALIAIGGSLGLLLLRGLGRDASNIRQAARLMLLGVSLALGPGLVLWVIPQLLRFPAAGRTLTNITTLAIPLLPFFYVYALYKQHLGGLEFRANRVLSLYGFLILFVTVFLVLFMIGAGSIQTPSGMLAFALVFSTAAVIAALFLRPLFQRFVDRLAYGTSHNPNDILRAFANEIPRALSRPDLTRLLTREVSSSLLIRQSALYVIRDGAAELIHADRAPLDQDEDAMPQLQELLHGAGRYRPPLVTDGEPFAWVRLAMRIEVRKKLVGLWLLGQRDPDDYYPQPDVELLAALANQIGVALETARLFENLQRRMAELEAAYRSLQKLDELKDEFVQTISHELRTPLTYVRGYAEALLDGTLGEITAEQREALETMQDRALGLIRLVNDVISIQQQALDRLDREEVYLPALARSCVSAAELVAGSSQPVGRHFSFALDVSENAPPIMGDRRRLAQVLDNLLENAVKFSPQGGAITVRVHPRRYLFDGQEPDAQPQLAVELSVSDQGIGIPADQLSRIWGRFYQVDGSSTRRFGGMGLGLAIVQGIVRAHGGVIWAESSEGAGATFRAVFPASPAADRTSAAVLGERLT
jgi:signal transduction histidine kinase